MICVALLVKTFTKHSRLYYVRFDVSHIGMACWRTMMHTIYVHQQTTSQKTRKYTLSHRYPFCRTVVFSLLRNIKEQQNKHTNVHRIRHMLTYQTDDIV